MSRFHSSTSVYAVSGTCRSLRSGGVTFDSSTAVDADDVAYLQPTLNSNNGPTQVQG